MHCPYQNDLESVISFSTPQKKLYKIGVISFLNVQDNLYLGMEFSLWNIF